MTWLHWIIPITLIGPIASIYYVTTPIEHRIGGWFRELASMAIGLGIYFWLFAACSEHFAANAGTTIAAALGPTFAGARNSSRVPLPPMPMDDLWAVLLCTLIFVFGCMLAAVYRAMAGTGSIPNVKGKITTSATMPPSPGTDPLQMPRMTPRSSQPMFGQLKTSIKLDVKASNI